MSQAISLSHSARFDRKCDDMRDLFCTPVMRAPIQTNEAEKTQ